MANRRVKPADLGAAIREELEIYATEVRDAVNEEGRAAMEKLVKITKKTAPVGKRKSHYRARITSIEKTDRMGNKRFIWGVKAPDYRLTHLLVHGHATKDGGRTRSDPFLQNALDQVLPEYEKAVEEAIKK